MTPRLLVICVALLVCGCFLPSLGSLADLGENAPFPSVLATYSQGSATLEVTRSGVAETIVLDRVGRGSQLTTIVGSNVTWRNDQGWILLVNVYELGPFFGPRASEEETAEETNESYYADVTIELIEGHEFWKADSYGSSGNRCIVDVDEADETEVRGRATCRGLRWTDGTVVPLNPDPILIEGQEPFDAEITFEARP